YGAWWRTRWSDHSGHKQRITQEAAKAGAAAADEGAVAFDDAESAHELPDRDLRFHAGERHAGASMDARGEGEMTVRLAPQVEPFRVDELRGIAVGGANADMDIGARGHVDAAERGVLGGTAVAELIRALHAQKLLDRRVDERGIVAQFVHRLRMPKQQVDAVADEVRRRLVAGVEQEDAIVQQLDLAQALARAARLESAGGDEGRQDLAFIAAAVAEPAPYQSG